MDAVLLALAAAAGAGALWWQQQRPTRVRALLASAFDGDAEVVLHVAQHECAQRGQALSSIHVLYGLMQDESIVDALRECGYDPEALETLVLRTLDEARTVQTPEVTERFRHLYAHAIYSAQHAGRKASRVDLWAYLAGTDAGDLLYLAGLEHVDVLFRLCHKHPPQPLDGFLGNEWANSDVHVVLRNDDYTTRDFVCEVLTTTFGYDAPTAETRMMETHTEGRGIVGRFAIAEAQTRIRRVRELARTRGYPLWVGIEPI
jgi:ATP-dependent Clp protease adaptor protein ClpS